MRYYTFILTLILSSIFTGYSQNASVKGKVLNPEGTAIESVNVFLENTDKGTATDKEGNYSIQNIAPGKYTLVFSYVSFKTKKQNIELKANQGLNLNITLEESHTTFDQVVISASRIPEKISDIPASVTIVGSTELKSLSTNTTVINDILEFAVPGLAPSTGTSSNFGQTLRGRKMLVMVDGIPQSTPLRNGEVDIKSIQPGDIERVEVVKGAVAIYGNGADGGTINYITKKPKKSSAFSASSNLWNTFNLSKSKDALDALGLGVQQSFTGALDKLSYYVSGSFEQTGNKYDGNGSLLAPTYGLDNSNIYSFLGKMSFSLNENQSIQLMINRYRAKQEKKFVLTRGEITVFNDSGGLNITPSIGSLPTDKNPLLGDPQGVKTTNIQFKYTNNQIVGSTTNFDVDLYYQKGRNVFFHDSKFFQGGGQPVVNSEKLGFRPIFHTNLDLFLFSLSINYGLDLLKDKTNNALLDGRIWRPYINLLSRAPFLQAKFKYKEGWVFKAGLRYDNMRILVNDFTTLPTLRNNEYLDPVKVTGGKIKFSNTSVNAGIRYTKHNEFIPFVSFSQGFSLPDMARLIGGGTAKNIVTLNPQAIKINNYEFGFLSKFKHLRFEAAGYYSVSNLGTGLRIDESNGRLIQSKTPQRIYGGEAALDFTFLNDNLQFGGSYSYVEGLEFLPDNPHELNYIGGDAISPPKTTAYITAKPTNKLSASLRMVQVGNRERFNVNETEDNGSITYSYSYREVPVKGYTLVNLTGNYQVNEKLNFSLGINNLFNKFYLPARSQWTSPLGAKTFVTAGEGINGRLAMSYQF
ncbi:MAG: TonB-dependent receptor [Tenacibaculum sp.]